MSASDFEHLREMQYEDALTNEEPWAMDAYEVRKWAAMQGLRVRAESDEYGPVEGIWDWHGQTGEDFFLVRILDEDGRIIAGTDPRNFDAVTPLGNGRKDPT